MSLDLCAPENLFVFRDPSINTYIQQIAGSSAKHDAFYNNAQIVTAYKKYINFFVNRYKNSPAIFAWELMNEPRTHCNHCSVSAFWLMCLTVRLHWRR
jgi:endo-1,4-beta-mannosidase